MPIINGIPTKTTVYPDREIGVETFKRWLKMRVRFKLKNHHQAVNFDRKDRPYKNLIP